MAVTNVVQAWITFDDSQDIRHTARPAFSVLRTIHFLIEAVNHNLQGCTQQLGWSWLFMRITGHTECCSGSCCKCLVLLGSHCEMSAVVVSTAIICTIAAVSSIYGQVPPPGWPCKDAGDTLAMQANNSLEFMSKYTVMHCSLGRQKCTPECCPGYQQIWHAS